MNQYSGTESACVCMTSDPFSSSFRLWNAGNSRTGLTFILLGIMHSLGSFVFMCKNCGVFATQNLKKFSLLGSSYLSRVLTTPETAEINFHETLVFWILLKFVDIFKFWLKSNKRILLLYAVVRVIPPAFRP
jgi:hypothetical protein